MDIENAKVSDFSPAVNGRFSVTLGESEDGSEPIEVELTEASELQSKAMGDATLECFSLLFKGGINTRLPQGMHTFSNEQLGSFELFITPVQHHDTEARYYEAVFNRVCE